MLIILLNKWQHLPIPQNVKLKSCADLGSLDVGLIIFNIYSNNLLQKYWNYCEDIITFQCAWESGVLRGYWAELSLSTSTQWMVNTLDMIVSSVIFLTITASLSPWMCTAQIFDLLFSMLDCGCFLTNSTLSINRIADINLFLNIIKPLSWELYLGCILLPYGLYLYNKATEV